MYNLEPNVGLEDLYRSFETFGDVKDIRDVPGRANARIIEFYDGALCPVCPICFHLGLVLPHALKSRMGNSCVIEEIELDLI